MPNSLVITFLKYWPLKRGKRIISRILERIIEIPKVASFNFRYGRFVDAPVLEWPRGYRELYLWGVMEECELAQWKRIVRKGDFVIDCGTNLGYWALVSSHLVGETGKVLGFEPVLKTYTSARQNILASARKNIVLKNAAVGDRHGQIELFLAKDDEAGARASSVQGGIQACGESAIAEIVRIDDLEETEKSKVALIKLDIEGGELAALKGAHSIIVRDRPVIAFEWNRVTANAAGYSPEQIRSFLEEKGYELWLSSASGLKPFKERSDLTQWSPMVWALPGNTS
jgi:FkbM family methyltransferase